jgi:hypothetical protein
VATLLAAGPATAQGWTAEKCSRYGQAWQDTIARLGTAGLGQAFLSAHQAFLDSGCRADVRRACPRSPAEIAVADRMTVLALNAGIAGTFLPFLCRP